MADVSRVINEEQKDYLLHMYICIVSKLINNIDRIAITYLDMSCEDLEHVLSTLKETYGSEEQLL